MGGGGVQHRGEQSTWALSPAAHHPVHAQMARLSSSPSASAGSAEMAEKGAMEAAPGLSSLVTPGKGSRNNTLPRTPGQSAGRKRS